MEYITVVNNLYLVVAYSYQVSGGHQAEHHLLRTDLHASPAIADNVGHKCKKKTKNGRKQISI